MMRYIILLTLPLFFCFSQISTGNTLIKKFTITGKVVDSNMKPVAGAVIFIDKIKTETVTDHEGIYKIKVNPDARNILVFTLFNGSVEEVINGRTTIDFILTEKPAEPTNKITDNETVNVGYGNVKKKEMTNQVGVINGQNPAFASYQSIYDMIRGRVPGVEVSGKSIKIMGSSSLNVSTEPLFVVDGVIVNNIDDISPQDVKSIEVLKGPAASVYGTKGANGVILVTRLSGKDRK
jgi:TonB-dependent SusC/RagA subfamily outer membrane receptor